MIMEQLETRLNVPEFESVPLYTDKDGVIRIKGTRVVLDVVIEEHLDGVMPEEIVRRFPTLRVSDVYLLIAYYLRHRNEVDTYLAEREQAAEELRQKVEADFPPDGIRERLLARLAERITVPE
jgi:uncharacterized protein (DUF433 family)